MSRVISFFWQNSYFQKGEAIGLTFATYGTTVEEISTNSQAVCLRLIAAGFRYESYYGLWVCRRFPAITAEKMARRFMFDGWHLVHHGDTPLYIPGQVA